MAQVFSTTMSASSALSVKVQPMASSMPMMRWLSATFCWQPKVSTSARGAAARRLWMARILSVNSR